MTEHRTTFARLESSETRSTHSKFIINDFLFSLCSFFVGIKSFAESVRCSVQCWHQPSIDTLYLGSLFSSHFSKGMQSVVIVKLMYQPWEA